MGKKGYIGVGLSLIIVGLTFFSVNFIEGFDKRLLWPIFLVIPIIFMVFDYFTEPDSRKDRIFPIVMLVQLLIFFMIWTVGFQYRYMERAWPFFILMSGIGALSLYYVKGSGRLLFIALSLVTLAIAFLLFTVGPFDIYMLHKIWPLFLVVAGLFVILFYFKIKK